MSFCLRSGCVFDSRCSHVSCTLCLKYFFLHLALKKYSKQSDNIIFNIIARKHLLISKTSRRCFEDISLRCLEDVFSATNFSSFKMSSRNMSSRGVWRLEVIMLKAPSRGLQNMSWGRLQDFLETNKVFAGKEYISVSNNSKSEKSKANPRQIPDALTRT